MYTYDIRILYRILHNVTPKMVIPSEEGRINLDLGVLGIEIDQKKFFIDFNEQKNSPDSNSIFKKMLIQFLLLELQIL